MMIIMKRREAAPVEFKVHPIVLDAAGTLFVGAPRCPLRPNPLVAMKPLRFAPLLLASIALACGYRWKPDASASADLAPAASPASPAPVTTSEREVASTAPPSASARPTTAGALGPLQRYALPAGERLSFDAVVVERLDAGSYGYLRVVRDDGSTSTWVATLRPSVEVGARVHVTAFGHTRDFDSHRLKRRFDDLHFAAVRRR
jgi:hypothetical protein